MDNCFMDINDLTAEIKNHFGSDYILDDIIRVLGGAQKHVYKVTCKNGFTFALYIWDKRTTYFAEDLEDDFTSSSAELFEINNQFLLQNDVATPQLYWMEQTKKRYNFEFAFVEYIDGQELESFIKSEPERAHIVLMKFKDELGKMHKLTSNSAGSFIKPCDGSFSCKDYIRDSFVGNLDYLSKNFEKIKSYIPKIQKVHDSMYNKLDNRNSYSFIHWELGPNHVMVDSKNDPYMIDIEGAKFFDLEYEHGFMVLRFGANYQYLAANGLEQERVDYYRFCHHLGSLAGAYELSHKNFYDMEGVNDIIAQNLGVIKEFCHKVL